MNEISAITWKILNNTRFAFYVSFFFAMDTHMLRRFLWDKDQCVPAVLVFIREYK